MKRTLTSSRSHHHATTDSVNGVWCGGGTDGDHWKGKFKKIKTLKNPLTPSESECSQETALLGEEDGLERVVHAEVQTAVDEDADGWNGETTVQTGDAVSSLKIDLEKI